jgi:YD repeat-containing protein
MRAGLLIRVATLLALCIAPGFAATTYVYDTLGRLSTVTYDNGLQIVYTYDAAGNRSAVTTQLGTNRPPQANNDSVSVFLNTLIHIHPLTNDVDPDGDTLQITQVGHASHGTATRASLTVANYTPANNYQGLDSFTYTISDGHGHTASATVFLAVATGIPPIAVNDSVNTPYQVAITFDPRANDTEPNPPGLQLSIASVTLPSNGTVVINNPGQPANQSVTYTPANGFEGVDGFSYTISDGVSQTASATVSVMVGAPPVAVADYTPTPVSTPVTFNPRVNDSDPYGLPLVIASAATPSHGTVAINNGLSLTYTPITGYAGPDSFAYTVANSAGLTASATDYMCPGNVPPAVTAHEFDIFEVHNAGDPIYPSGTYDPRTTGDTDPCNGALTVTAVTQGAKGTVSIQPSGPAIFYKYNELVYASRQDTDTFTYTVTDSFGNSSTGTINVVIDVETRN